MRRVILQRLGPEVGPGELRGYSLACGASIYPIASGEYHTGLLVLPRGTLATLRSGPYAVRRSARASREALLFSLHREGAEVRVCGAGYRLLRYFSGLCGDAVAVLEGRIRGLGSWLSEGRRDAMIEAWTVSPARPMICVLRAWSASGSEARVSVEAGRLRRELRLPLRPVGRVRLTPPVVAVSRERLRVEYEGIYLRLPEALER